jgi:hypothetical protein
MFLSYNFALLIYCLILIIWVSIDAYYLLEISHNTLLLQVIFHSNLISYSQELSRTLNQIYFIKYSILLPQMKNCYDELKDAIEIATLVY